MSAALALAKMQFRILRNDPWFLLIMFVMPLAVMPLFKKTIRLSLVDNGFTDATGAEFVVPGQVVLFGFFVAGSVGFSLYREHGWKTWDRLRASAAPSHALLAGFALPWIVIHVIFQLTLFFAGFLIMGLRFNGGSPVALILVCIGFGSCIVAVILLASISFRTVNQVSALSNVGAIAFGGLGGALVPLEQLPGWAQTIAPVAPQYWAMRGFRTILLEQGGVSDVLVDVAVLIGAAIVIGFVASLRFRADETKEFFA